MKTLIVIDMQNDFIDGSLGTKEAQLIVPKVKKKIREYKTRGDRVIFTKDTHDEQYLKTNEGKHLPYEHCIKGTYGWDIADGLGNPGDECKEKHTFGYKDWALYDCEEIELVGLCTDICVVSNALILKAMYPDSIITVDASCCAGTSIEAHNAALSVMKSCQIEIINEN